MTFPEGCEDGLGPHLQEEAKRLASEERVKEAEELLKKWGLPDIRDLIWSEEDLPEAAVVSASFRQGVFNMEDVEQWFVKKIRGGDVGHALHVLEENDRRKRELSGVATLLTLELIENEKYIGAGRIINAFDMQKEFEPELENILPALLDSRRTAVASALLSGLGTQVPSGMGSLFLSRAKEYVKEGHVATAVGLFHKRGVRYLADEFFSWLSQRVNEAIRQQNTKFLSEVLEIRSIWDRLSQDILVEAAAETDLKFPVYVKHLISNKGYGFVGLPGKADKAFFHRSDCQVHFDGLERKDQLYAVLRVTPKGPKAIRVTRRETQKFVVSKNPEVGKKRNEATEKNKKPTVEDLADRWGAKVSSINGGNSE